MKKTRIVITLAFVLAFTAGIYAQTDKELTIKTARALETSPLAQDTVKMREKALKWVIETDQVSVIACGEIFSLFSDKKNKNSSEMTVAYTIGMAAFKLEFPEKASDENAAQLAGLETALKSYEAIVKEKPKTKFEKIEAVLEKQRAGQLAAMVTAADCGKK
jgi:hypothetical protein